MRLKCCLSCTEISEMLISPSQLNTAQIQNRSDRKGGWLKIWGFTSTLITKCILNMRPTMRAAAKVFIYIKRLSTYIIRIITNERSLKKKLQLMTHHTISPNFKNLFHHLPIRCDFIFSLGPGDIKFWRKDLFTYISINKTLLVFQRASVAALWSP